MQREKEIYIQEHNKTKLQQTKLVHENECLSTNNLNKNMKSLQLS